jgi:hypothetical protein
MDHHFVEKTPIDIAGWIASERSLITSLGTGGRIMQNWILLEFEYKDGIMIELSRHRGVQCD